MTDLIVIGGGPGGTATAMRAAQLGGQVTLVERSELGGNCVNRNCVPFHTFLASARLVDQIRRAGEWGIEADAPRLHLDQVMARKDAIVQELREGMAGLLASYSVEVVQGSARLLGPGHVEVNGQRIEASAVVIATGARLATPPSDFEASVNPQQALELKEVPASLLVVGDGPVECEFSILFHLLGSQVTMVMEAMQPLPDEDYEVGQRLAASMQERGIELLTRTSLRAVRRENGRLVATVAGRNGGTDVSTDQVLWMRREPAITDLGLDEAGVRLQTCTERSRSDDAIAVDDRMQTNLPGVYAVGDVTGPPMFSHLATAQGLVAAENAMGRSRRMDYRAVPRCAYTVPEVACVGLTEDQAEDEGYQVEVSNIPFDINARALAAGDTQGGVKIVSEAEYGRVLGVHIVGPQATELIAEASLAIQLETLAEDLAWAVRGHPTLSETLPEAARAILGQALYLPKW
ncbi:MAG: dihydrolipoyl dehydrogenase [Anaerolineae bacterium]